MSSGVEFDEDKFRYGHPVRPATSGQFAGQQAPYSPSSDARGMIGWLVRRGWVKSEGAAQGILLGIVIANMIIMFIVITYYL